LGFEIGIKDFMSDVIIGSRNSEKTALLSNSACARKIPIPLGWSKIRVGVRVQADASGATITTPTFALGLCSGTSNIFGDATVTHFVGFADILTWTPSSGWFQISVKPSKKVGSTLTQGTAIGSPVIWGNLGTDPARRSLLFADITKGSPNYTINFFARTALSVSDPTATDFVTQMSLASPSLANHAAGTNQTIAVDEGTDGTLDSLNLFWSGFPNLEISDFGFSVLS
jgi:hypothetical protein